jgi:hypothetical protein
MFAVKASWWSPQGRGGVCKPRQPSRAIRGSTCPIDCALPHPIPAHPHTPATPQSASWEEVLLQGMCWEGVLCAGTTAHYARQLPQACYGKLAPFEACWSLVC